MKILIAGDFSPKYRIADLIKQENADFLFKDVKKLIDNSDYSIVNFESVVTDERDKPIYKYGPNLSCTSKSVDLLKRVGFDCVTLANNHFRDYGDSAIIKTLDLFNQLAIDYVGGGVTLSDSQKILIKEFTELKIAIVNICESEFSIAKGNRAGCAPIDTYSNFMQIKEAQKNADKVIVIVHGGYEHFQYPSKRMKYLYRYFIEIGADAVINHHQHCFSGYEIYKGCPIVFGLGNFLFDNPNRRNSEWNKGYIAYLHVEKKMPINLEVIPYLQCNDNPAIQLLDGEDINSFKRTLNQINQDIQDDNSLEVKMNEFMKSKRKAVIGALAPYSNDYVRAASGRGWIPQFLSKNRVVCLYNYLSCESQRDCTLSFLESIIENE